MDAKDSLSGKRVVKNALYNSSAWIATVVIGIVATPYIVYKLDFQGYGIYALFSSFVGYYGLLDLGLGQGTTKFVAQFRAMGDDENLVRSINAALWVQVVTGFFGSAVMVLLGDNILLVLKVPQTYLEDAKFGLYASALGFLFTMVTGTLSSALMGLQRYDITSRTNLLTNMLLTLSIIVMLYAGFGLRTVLATTSLSAVIVCAIYYISIRSLLPHWSPFGRFEYKLFKVMFGFSGYMFVFKLSSVSNNQLVRFIVSAVLSPAAVTFYVVPMKIITAIGGLLGNITTVLFPLASELNAGGNTQRLHNIFINSSKYVTTLALPLYAVLAFLSVDILTVWMGADFAVEGGAVMSILAIAYFVSSLTMVPANIAIGIGASKIVAFFSVIVIILSICLILPFSIAWGVSGTAVAILLIQLEAPVFIAYVTKKVIGVGLWMYFKKSLSFHLFGGLALVAFFVLSKTILTTNHLASLVLLSVATVCLYYGATIVFGWVPFRQLAGLVLQKRTDF